MHLGLVVAGGAKHLDDFADGILCAFGPFGDAGNSLVAGLSLHQFANRDKDVVGHRLVVGDEEREIFALFDSAYESGAGTLNNADYLALLRAILGVCKERDLHLVAVKGVVEIFVGDGNLDVAVVGRHKSQTLLAQVDSADDDTRIDYRVEIAVAVFGDAAGVLQFVEHDVEDLL